MEPAPVLYDWTGFHAGAHLGYGWSDNGWTRIRSASGSDDRRGFGSHSADGVLGGLQLGYTHQFDQFVFGVEGDFSWTGMDGSVTWIGGSEDLYRDGKSDYNWLATLAVRAGLAVDRTLFYLKGGGAWADVDYSHTGGGPGSFPRVLAGDATRSGWLVGAGVEHAFLDDWSVKLEYN